MSCATRPRRGSIPARPRSCPRRWASPAAAAPRGSSTDGPEHVVVRATASDRALLVLADTWFPGWRAKIDGRSVPTMPHPISSCAASSCPAGAHTVEFTYVPWS